MKKEHSVTYLFVIQVVLWILIIINSLFEISIYINIVCLIGILTTIILIGVKKISNKKIN